jgi:hypothetical protein
LIRKKKNVASSRKENVCFLAPFSDLRVALGPVSTISANAVTGAARRAAKRGWDMHVVAW